MLITIAKKSLFNRKITALLTIISIAVSVFVLVGVEHIRFETKSNFTRTLSDTDLIVGARSGEIHLLLYSVFRLGNATNNITWKNYQKLANDEQVAWTIPISLGDSHRGYRVIGTNTDYFKHYKYADKQPLAIQQGKIFNEVFDIVLGAEVAKQLGYTIDTPVVLTHGIAEHSFNHHDDKPFQVVGILAPTGTPVDKTLHVSLEAIEAIHLDWHNNMPMAGQSISANDVNKYDLQPESITAFLVGLKSNIYTFAFQRHVNDYPKEALMAILPGATLASLWQTISSVEKVLIIISALVLFSALIGMSTMLLSSLRERNRELAILRAIGASPIFSLILIELEVLLLTISGIALALLSLFITITLGKNILIEQYGLFISSNFLRPNVMILLLIVLLSALLLGLIPALLAYRQSLQQGLIIKQ